MASSSNQAMPLTLEREQVDVNGYTTTEYLRAMGVIGKKARKSKGAKSGKGKSMDTTSGAKGKFDPPEPAKPDAATLKTIAEKTEQLRAAVAELKAKKIADDIAMIYKGEIIWHGPAGTIDDSGNPCVEQFIHGRAEGPIQMQVRRL